MKVLVVEVKGKYAVALNKQGEFVKLGNNGQLHVGCECDYVPNRSFGASTLLKAASMAAAFLFTIGLSYGVYSYSKPYSYVDIDINPSVEITSNIFDRIIKVKGLNDDGTKLLTNTNYRNMRLEDGVEGILKSAFKSGYLKTDSNNSVVFTVVSINDKKSTEIKKEVEITAQKEIGEVSKATEILIEKATPDKHKSATDMGISPGKLVLIEKLIEAKPELKIDDLKDEPVKDIMKSIKEAKKQESDKEAKDQKLDELSNKDNNTQDNKNTSGMGHEADSNKDVKTQANDQNAKESGNKYYVGKGSDKDGEGSKNNRKQEDANNSSKEKTDDKSTKNNNLEYGNKD